MKRHIMQLIKFHTAFDIPILKTPQIPSQDRIDLRQNLLEEEVQELKDAAAQKNIVEVADAITDCMYILLGTALEFGLAHKLEECFDEVHRSNMSKLDENGNRVVRADGKILKSNLYSPPDLASIINLQHAEEEANPQSGN